MGILNIVYKILKLITLIFFAAAMIGACIWIYQRIKYPDFFYSQNQITDSNEQKMNDFAKVQEDLKTTENEVFSPAGYKSLKSEKERYIYKIVKENLENITEKRDQTTEKWELKKLIVKNCNIDVGQLSWILFLILSDNPDVFWISDTVRLANRSDNSISIDIFSVMSPQEKNEKQKILDQKIDQIIKSIPKEYSNYAKELYLHDYIVSHCEYILKGDKFPLIYTSYGCLIDGESVCQGYSRAFQLLLTKIGINSQIIVGYRKTNEKHMWNAVKLNQNWYYVDITWDKTDLLHRYTYFNITKEMLEKDHILSPIRDPNVPIVSGKPYNFNIPHCKSIEENYFKRNAIEINNLNNFNNNKNLINSKINNSTSNVIYIKFSENLNFSNAKNYILQNASSFFNVYKKEKFKISHADILNQNVFAIKII